MDIYCPWSIRFNKSTYVSFPSLCSLSHQIFSFQVKEVGGMTMSLRDILIQRGYWPRDEVSAFWEKCPLSLLINQTDINSWNLNPIQILLKPLFSSEIILWDKLYLAWILVIHNHKPINWSHVLWPTPYLTPLSLLLASIPVIEVDTR